MIRFWTRSLRYSTDVPGVSDGLCAPAMVSEYRDCASHSRGWGVTVGDVVEEGKLEALEAVGFKDWGVIEPDEEVDLKDERKFWAEDLRRIAGRCGCSENMLYDLQDQIARRMYVLRPCPTEPEGKLMQISRATLFLYPEHRNIMADINTIASQFVKFYYDTFASSREALLPLYVRPSNRLKLPSKSIWCFSAAKFHAHLWGNSKSRGRRNRQKT